MQDVELDEVTYEVSGAVAVITLNRPKVLNAISGRPGGTRDQIVFLLERAERDGDIGAIVLRGAGRSFCGGGDLSGNARRDRSIDDFHFAERAAGFHHRISTSALPIVAAVHGHCLGAGVLLAASCDMVVAADGATFGFPEGRLGLVGASALVPVIGRQWAKFLSLTGESISAARAVEIGLVMTTVPDARVFERSRDLADRIARMPRHGVHLNRRAIDAVGDAAGDAAARTAALAHDTLTLSMAAHATAPDGRTFRSILDAEGMDGLKAARAAQYESPWLAP
jgi:enoyl-CoA hydratase/carnithine racemase